MKANSQTTSKNETLNCSRILILLKPVLWEIKFQGFQGMKSPDGGVEAGLQKKDSTSQFKKHPKI